MRRAALLVSLFLCLPATAAARGPRQTIYKIPSSIKANCAATVDDKISAWLATVPDNSTAQFAPGRCYSQDGTITVTGRRNLVIDGQGSEFRALTPGGSHRANWRFVNGSNLTVQNLAVRGTDPQGIYDPAVEWQHGFSIEGVQGMTLSNVQARETWGDGIDIYRGAFSPACGDDASSARDIAITGSTLERNGRQGLAVVDAERVSLQSSTINQSAWWNVDLETDDTCDIGRHITIAHNSFGASRYGAVGSVGAGGSPQVGDVSVTDNVQTASAGPPGECWAPIWVLSPDGLYRDGYTFARNTLLARRNAFEFRRLSNVTVDANAVTFDTASGCGGRAGVLLADSSTVGITNNAFTGANRVLSADALSSGVTESNNSL
jgi:hypothetical protein